MRHSVSLFFAVLGLIVFQGCTAIQGGVNNGPSAAAWKNGVRGTWQLSSIEKENFPADYVVKSLFDEAPPECFTESVWTLPSHGAGSITFTSAGRLCAPGAVRNIEWSIYNDAQDGTGPFFQFKKIYPGDNPRHVLTGYRMVLAYADEQVMRMVMQVPLDGQMGRLVFNYTKVQ